MRFDVNRLSKLAGLPGGNGRRSLNEASNRSYHEDPSVSDEAAYRYGNGQLSEMDDHGKKEGHSMHRKMMEKEDVGETKYEEANMPVEEMMGKHMEEGGHENQAEAVYEIDEADLVSELRRLRVMTKINNTKKRQQRRKALQEAQLRQIIEEEVDNVFKDLENGKLDLNISGDWVYGKNKPRNSRRGRIARGFKSIGFK